MDITTVIQNQHDLFVGNPASITDIKQAENKLNVAFSKDYKDYLLAFGFAIFEGHELTGLCDGRRLDVVKITLDEKDFTQAIPDNWYVIEQTNVDGIVIWQDSQGQVYQVAQNGTIQNVYDSLCDYIKKTNNE